MTTRLLAAIVCLASLAAHAAGVGGVLKPASPTPKTVERLILDEARDAATLTLPALDAAAKRGLEEGLVPNQVGVSRKADVRSASRIDADSLHWERAASGYAAQVRIASPGALALRAGLRFTAMPNDLEIRVAPGTAAGETVRTSASALFKLTGGVWPIVHWTAATEGDVQVLEFWSARIPRGAELAFSLDDVSHILAKVDFTCHVDIACIPDANVRTDGRAVARMRFTDGGRTFVCTGSLLNDASSSMQPLLATANHCISTAAAAATLETLWFYYPDTCGGLAIPNVRVPGGAALLMADFDNDFTLLRLAQSAPAGAYFLGWDPAQLPVGAAVFGIHHPAGEAQRYMAGTMTGSSRVTDSTTHITFGEPFYRIAITQGIIEGGSSGSPLLTAPGTFRGTLFGSPSSNSCGGNITGSYSDFSIAYPLVSTFLAGPSATDDHGDTPGAATTINPGTKLVGQINRDGDVDWFRVVFPAAGTWTIGSFNPSDSTQTDVAGQVFASDGVTLLDSGDDLSPTNRNFEITRLIPAAGTYFVQVSGHAGTVGAYGLSSRFEPPDDHGNSSATATPIGTTDSKPGFLGSPTDTDWFRITFDRDGAFRASSTGTVDLVGTLYRADGVTVLAEDDDYLPSPDRNFLISTAVTAGTYYLKVRGFDGDTGSYGLNTSFSLVVENPNFTDLWWNPAEAGWGININHQSSTVFATLFTYAADGRGLWLVASGLTKQPSGEFTGPLYRSVGPPFNAVPWTSVTLTQVGSMTITFFANNQASLQYTFNGTTVEKLIQRQVFATLPSCTFTSASRAGATNYQDLWWNPAESGWGLNIAHQGSILFATLFDYGADNRDLWFVASSLTRQPDGSFSGDLYSTTGPPFNAVPWRAVTLTRVGAMRVAFASGNAGTLTYDVNGVSVTKQIERQVFGATPTVCN
jgi:hypothetical protein